MSGLEDTWQDIAYKWKKLYLDYVKDKEHLLLENRVWKAKVEAMEKLVDAVRELKGEIEATGTHLNDGGGAEDYIWDITIKLKTMQKLNCVLAGSEAEKKARGEKTP